MLTKYVSDKLWVSVDLHKRFFKRIFSHKNDVKRDEKNVAKRNDDHDHEIQNHEIKMFQLMISRLLLKVKDFILSIY